MWVGTREQTKRDAVPDGIWGGRAFPTPKAQDLPFLVENTEWKACALSFPLSFDHTEASVQSCGPGRAFCGRYHLTVPHY